MSEETTTTTGSEPAGATVTGSEGATGPGATVSSGPQEEHFFDPQEYERLTASLPDNLKGQAAALRKSLQAAFTKKTQSIAEQRKKIEAYDTFAKDPATAMQQMARQMGYTLTRAEAQAAVDGKPGARWGEEGPKSWDEVLDEAENRAYSRIMREFQPIVGEIQSLKKSTLEKHLDDTIPDWREHEDAMMENLKTHPSLVKDPAKLYRISVPAEVLESRAMQSALRKLEEKGKAAKTAGASTTTKKPSLGDGPPKGASFAETVAFAKAKLAELGLHPPK